MRIAVFVDGANVFHMQKKYLGWMIDLKKLLEYFKRYGEVVDAYYYTAIDAAQEAQNRFVQMLPFMGYAIISKPLKCIRDGDMVYHKGNLDIEIVLDMFNTIENYDMAVLVSGDGDFERALRQLRARGKQFLVVSSAKTVARELLAVAGMRYLDIATIEEEVRLTGLPKNLQEIGDIHGMLEDMSVESDFPV
jgi:uncharacterized LabA/DUF88 family protein